MKKVPEGSACSPSPATGPVHRLRRRWKSIKDGEASSDSHEVVRIRLHRCLSWLSRVEELERASADSDDARLIYGWIALNSLYGQWDGDRREPVDDRSSLDLFLKRIFEADAEGRLEGLMDEHRRLAKSIVSDAYLSKHFWREPTPDQARRAESGGRRLSTMIVEDRHRAALDETLQRVYLARCQLVHGAATYQSSLNRDAVRRCALFLQLFLVCMCDVIIDGAWRQPWGELCYPPKR